MFEKNWYINNIERKFYSNYYMIIFCVNKKNLYIICFEKLIYNFHKIKEINIFVYVNLVIIFEIDWGRVDNKWNNNDIII